MTRDILAQVDILYSHVLNLEDNLGLGTPSRGRLGRTNEPSLDALIQCLITVTSQFETTSESEQTARRLLVNVNELSEKDFVQVTFASTIYLIFSCVALKKVTQNN